jgi:Homing endonuclease associated repeat/HNH endonuclease
MSYTLDTLHRNVPDQELLDDLQKVATELELMTVSIAQYNLHGRFNSSTLQRRFSSWNISLTKAGLAATRVEKLTEEALFANLVEVWAHIGRQPRHDDLNSQASRISVDTYKRRYGGWRKALESFVIWANQSDVPLPSSPSAPFPKKHLTPRNINYRLRFLVMRRDNFKCRITGRSPATDPTVILEVDHIHPWEQGGETILENLQTLAKEVNLGKSNLLMQSDVKG